MKKEFSSACSNQWKVSVPGSFMVMGEHAVLWGKGALVCAIDKRIEILLQPRNDQQVVLHSDQFPSFTCTLTSLQSQHRHDGPILQILKSYQKSIPSGLEITISGSLTPGIGLGSSTALIVGVVALLHWWIDKKKLPQGVLLQESVEAIRRWQQYASGADAAASIYGGLVYFRGIHTTDNKPMKVGQESVMRFEHCPLNTMIYSGTKIPTKQVIDHVQAYWKNSREKLALLYQDIDQLVQEAVISIKKKDWKSLGSLYDQHQQCLEKLGVSNEKLANMLLVLRNNSDIEGAKISGAGLGDCIIGLGKLSELEKKAYHQKLPFTTFIEVNPEPKGILYAEDHESSRNH